MHVGPRLRGDAATAGAPGDIGGCQHGQHRALPGGPSLLQLRPDRPLRIHGHSLLFLSAGGPSSTDRYPPASNVTSQVSQEVCTLSICNHPRHRHPVFLPAGLRIDWLKCFRLLPKVSIRLPPPTLSFIEVEGGVGSQRGSVDQKQCNSDKSSFFTPISVCK
jgi:hypothetical protein